MTSETGTEQKEVPRTDICEECEGEIVPEVEKVTGQHELIHGARESDEGFMPVTAGSVEIVFSCRCSHMRVEYGPGSTSAWKVPDEWMWEDEVDVEEDDGLRADGGYPWNVRINLGGVTFEGPGMGSEQEAQAIKEIVESSEPVDGVQVIRQ